jgi:SAM-dependent methyltransferase
MLHAHADAFGQALQDHHAGRPGPTLLLDVEDGSSMPALPPAWFFQTADAWPAAERQVLAAVAAGPVLDLGCGAGRHALHLQQRGYAVTAIDMSPGAVAVCRARGLRDVRLGDLTDPPGDQRWGTVLLLCGNLGLAGDWDGTRRLLVQLAALAAPGARLIGDSVDPTITDNPRHLASQQAKRAAGVYVGHVRLRLRYGDVTTPWWEQLNFRLTDIGPLIAGTGWEVAAHRIDGADHYIILTKPAEHEEHT